MRKFIYESPPKTQEWYVRLNSLLPFYALRVEQVIPTNDSSVSRSGPAWEDPAELRPNFQAADFFLVADLDVGAQDSRNSFEYSSRLEDQPILAD